MLTSIAQVKVGSVSVHKFSIFQGIKNMMAHCENGTQNECSYGCYERSPCLVMTGLYFEQSILGLDLPMLERPDLAPVVLLVQQGCGFQRTLSN